MRTVEFTVGGFQVDSRPIAYHGPDGRPLSAEETRAFAADVHAVDAVLPDIIAASRPTASYRDVTDEALSRQGWSAERTQRVREYLEHRAEEQYGAWIEDLAAHGLDDDAIEGDEVVFPDGYGVLPERLAEGLDIRLEHLVTRVDWSDDGVWVRTSHGDFSGDTTVITVPVGVLQAGTMEIVPPLPPVNAEALGRLRMNAFEKVFLRFPTRFWEDGVYALRQQGPEARWWHSWYDLTALNDEPLLLTFAAGPAAAATRDWSDAEVQASIMAQLRRLYGDGIPDPIGMRRTAWQDDPFAHGSYAYMTVGSTTADHDDLATPVGGVLHLAGEATWTDDPATVPAALFSGHRAAERILGRAVPIERLWTPE